jgi:hypothetical protein
MLRFSMPVVFFADRRAGKICASPEDLLKPARECQLLRVLVLSWNEVANRHVPK